MVDSHMQCNDAGEEEEGAEIVLEKSDFDHVDNTINNQKAKTTKRYNKNSGYKLRRFLSTPNSKNSQMASSIASEAL